MRQIEHRVYISLGSNINPAENIQLAVKLLHPKLNVIFCSTVWETPPIGTGGSNFYNLAIASSSPSAAEEIKYGILRPIEEELGRIRTKDKFAPRPIDLDIVLFDSQLFEPRLWTLAYLAVPMSELLPDLTKSPGGETLQQVAHKFLTETEIIPHPELVLT